MSTVISDSGADSIGLVPVDSKSLPGWLDSAEAPERRWVEHAEFRPVQHSLCIVPSPDGSIAQVLVGMEDPDDPWCLAHLPPALPRGTYRLEADWSESRLLRAATGWRLGAYRFDRYRTLETPSARLALESPDLASRASADAAAIANVRDLINTPACDMMPEQLGDAVAALASAHGATVRQIVGDDLLEEGYPAIHAVGRASAHPPRLIDLRWGEPHAPRLTLVGKGVCFDSGGLDIKSASGMRLMKKDMGGAAQAIGLADLVMSHRLRVNLRLLIPAVENAISGNAYRPGDILTTRKGLTVEVDNTDAEGRIVLCDALAEGATENPDVMIDFATLTGAARVALGTEVPAMFANDDGLADSIFDAGRDCSDPVWRLPLHRGYRELIESRVADIVNSTGQPYGGAITAALFLEAFVPETISWVHFDVMAWNLKARPGRPEGGEAMGIRAVLEALKARYG